MVAQLVKKLPCLLPNQMVITMFKNQLLKPIISQLYRLCTLPFTNHVNIILPSKPRSPRWFLHFRFCGQHFVNFLCATVRVCCSSYGKTTNCRAI